MSAHVAVNGLHIVTDDGRDIVRDISFAINKGEVLALIGESGSGKTTTALTLLGYVRNGLHLAGGQLRVGDAEGMAALAALRGDRISYIAQNAGASFNPALKLIDQVIEPALRHGRATRAQAVEKAIGLFRAMALPSPETIGERYPHQLSGGQLQRLMAAMAFITDPELVIFDEPTTALDVTTQVDVLRAFKAVVQARQVTAVYVSHDLAVVAQMADQIVVLEKGLIREAGQTPQILHQPQDDYTRTLMAAADPKPRVLAAAVADSDTPLLQVQHLTAHYGARAVVQDVGFVLRKGAMLGIIGESGSGKSTIARLISGLMRPSAGEILLDGKNLAPDIRGRSRSDFQRIQLVVQNAATALNPAHKISQILARPLAFYHGITGAAADARVRELLDLTRLPSALADAYPTALSGGQMQRVNLARALAAKPDVLICDEVTSALDTVVAAAILDLLTDVRQALGVSMIFISHDISTVRSMCDDILVLQSGIAVEQADRVHFEQAQHHGYTQQLLASVPQMRKGWLEEQGQISQ